MSAALRLDGRVVLVTGASSGLGKHFAHALAARGARLVLGARRIEALEEVRDALRGTGAEAEAVVLDVADESSTISAYDFVERRFGGVDSVIANAGVNLEGAAIDLPVESFDQVQAVNVRGTFLTAREAARRMLRADAPTREHGRIVVIASIMGQIVKTGMPAYCASKAAVLHLTRALAREWARQGISINAICPGYIPTELTQDWFETPPGQRFIGSWPRRRLMAAEDLDEMLVYLASDAARSVTGSIFTVDDGQSL
jgi:NAD(P)-dependent dehydrogenase (short-subunit alcohol dehydrogenase family)